MQKQQQTQQQKLVADPDNKDLLKALGEAKAKAEAAKALEAIKNSSNGRSIKSKSGSR